MSRSYRDYETKTDQTNKVSNQKDKASQRI